MGQRYSAYMAERQLTQFEHILLGLICLQPSSGYDLKRRFALTPIGVYQPSSGALYPALRRLDRMGLVRAQEPSGQAGQPARHRRGYEPTPAGRAAHLSWLRAPVTPATVARDLGLHVMRFVLMEDQLPRPDVLAFLHDLAGGLAEFTAGLERYYATGTPPGHEHARLAVEHGLATHRATLRWAEHAIRALSDPDDASGPILGGYRDARSSSIRDGDPISAPSWLDC
jgi:PadR family transcriptional regulator AphA